ncbi:MAG: DUF305 domain-containing protein [Pseudomonadota bacterium]
MKKYLVCISAAALVSTLAACGENGEPANTVVANDMNAMAMDPNDPFAQSEMTMDRAMMAAVGVDAIDSWVKKMIEHHRGAVEMSRIVLAQSPTADVAALARTTIAMQGKEIADLEKLLATGTPDPASAMLYRASAMEMHGAMMAASGATISETYLRKMLAHHRGAVTMSDVALANGATGAIRAQIEKTRTSQQKEVVLVEAMLRGEPMAVEPSATTASSTATPAAKPAEPSAAAPKPAPARLAPATPKPAAPAPDPHAGHDMNNM